jgi:hypothetical protein
MHTRITDTEGLYEKKLHEELRDELSIWRLILEKITSLQELETLWNLDDVMRANALLDMQQDLSEMARRKAQCQHR